MPMHDYVCGKCKNRFEEIVALIEYEVDGKKKTKCPDTVPCDACGADAHLVYSAPPKQFNTIIPDYPGSKKRKAGYQHTHIDRPATKVLGKGWSPT